MKGFTHSDFNQFFFIGIGECRGKKGGQRPNSINSWGRKIIVVLEES